MRRGVLALSMVLTAGCGAGDESAINSRSVKSVLQPQQVVSIELSPADAVLAEKFTKVTSVRELSTGRILITDEADNRIILADFRTDNTTVVGRIGRGPEEYGQVGRLFPLAGDSSLMHDWSLGRWLLLHESRIVGTISRENAAVRATGSHRLAGADAQSVVVRLFPSRRGIPTSEPGEVVRVRRSDGRSETIARITRFNDGTPPKVALADPPGTALPPNPTYVMSLFVNDQVAYFPDGWTAIARYNPYRVDWCPPDDECVTGPVLETPRPMTDDDKRAHLAVAEEMLGWPRTNKLSQTDGSWPKLLPPFIEPVSTMDGSSLYPLPDGRLLIERLPMSIPQWTYDVIDRSGIIVGRLTLPRGERIVAIGKSSIYAVAKNELDLQELRRHPWLTTPLPIERE